MCFNNTPVLNSAAVLTATTEITDTNIQENLNFDVDKAKFQVELSSQDPKPLSGFLAQPVAALPKSILRSPETYLRTSGQTFFKSDGTPVVRSITDVDVDQVNIVVGVPALTRSRIAATLNWPALQNTNPVQRRFRFC